VDAASLSVGTKADAATPENFKPAAHCARYESSFDDEQFRISYRAVWRDFRVDVLFERNKDGGGTDRMTVFHGNRPVYRSKPLEHVALLQLGSAWNCSKEDLNEAALRQTPKALDRRFELVDLQSAKAAQRWLIPGRDLTGNGRGNLAVFTRGGGNRSPYTLHLFEVRPRFRLLLTQEVDRTPDTAFRDLDNDGTPELVNHEPLEIHPSMGEPDLEQIMWVYVPAVYKLRGNRYRFMWKLMKRPPHSPTQLEALVKSSRKNQLKNQLNTLAQNIVVLVSSGNAGQARELAIRTLQDKQRGLRYFDHVLNRLRPDPYWGGSTHWSALKRLNGGRL
jgi:hypothetical protein